MSRSPQSHNNLIRALSLLFLLFLTAASVCAQSQDASAPTPVHSNTITARIAARDLGDARLTDHYYALTGTPGDLLITVQSDNLNGDLDVFTAGTLRPLLKLTLYAESSAPVTKGIYLRRREDLVLRIEARTPNDDRGTYRVFFGGSFEPIPGGPDIVDEETAAAAPKTETSATGHKTKRVSSVGARIEEPEPPPTEVAAAPTPEPTPEPSPEAKPVESPKSGAETTEATKTPRRIPPGRRLPRRTTTATTVKPKPAEPEAREPKPKPEPKQPPSEAGREAEPETGPRLVIETNDGTLINRPMSTVRRVTVENGQVVVTGRDGKIQRFLLADVIRMSISP